MSVLLFPPTPLDRPEWLTALGAVAVAEVVEEFTGRPARIKWPNDVRVDGRKIAGVLVERGPGSTPIAMTTASTAARNTLPRKRPIGSSDWART